MVEVTIVMMVMLVAISIFSNTVLSTSRQREINRENSLAAEAARVAIETMMNARFEDRFAQFNADPADDPGGAGTAPGNWFPVQGLQGIGGNPAGMVGEILMPATVVGAGLELREDFVDVGLGMPRDLNGDRVVDGDDHAGDYILIPVLVRLRWQGRNGQREFRVYTQMTNYQW